MKRSFFLSLMFAFACCLFANQTVQAQYAEGISAITYDSSAQMIFTYSATEVDFNTSYYYDAYVCGSLYNNVLLGMWCEGDPNEDRIAEVYLQTAAQYNQGYLLVSNHYVEGYFEVWEPTWGYYGYWDPYGYDFLPGGSYPGGYTFLPSGQTITQYGQIYLGDTSVWLFVYTNIPGQIDLLGFKGDHQIHEYGNGTTPPATPQPIDDGDQGEAIWYRTPPGSKPAAYTRGTKPKMNIWIQFDQSVPANTAVTVRAKYNNTPVATKTTTIQGSGPKISDIEMNANLESDTSKVMIGNYTLAWELTYDGQNWLSLGNSGPHKIYWTYGTPIANPFVIDVLNNPGPGGFIQDVYPQIYDRALEIACGNANGASSIQDIVNANNQGVYDNAPYDYRRTPSVVHPLDKYNATIPNNGSNCMSHASLLTGLLRSIGIPASTNYLWGGTAQERHYFRYPGTPTALITVKLTRPPYNRFGYTEVVNPHFNYHALTTVNNINYDPSYGLPNANTPTASIQAEEAYNKTTSAWDVNNTGFTTTYRSNAPTTMEFSLLPFCDHP